MGRSNFSTNELLNAVTKRSYNRYQTQTVDYQHLEAATTTTGFVSNRREYSSAALLADTFSLNKQNLIESNYDPFLKSVGQTDWLNLLNDLLGENAGDDLGRQFSLSSDGTKLAVLVGTHIRVYEFDSTPFDVPTQLTITSTYTYPSGSADVITGIAEGPVALLTRTVGGTIFATIQRFDSTLTPGVSQPDVWSGVQAPSVFSSSDGNRVALSFPDQGFRIYDGASYYVIDGTETVTFTVTVKSVGGGNRYRIDGVDRPSLAFKRGSTYVFDMSDESNLGHPLAFSEAFNGASSSYSGGVVNNYSTNIPGSSGSSVTFTVPSDAPSQIYYYCTVHGQNMGSSASSTVTSPLHGGVMSRNGLRVVTMDGTYDIPSVTPTQPISLQRLTAVPRIAMEKILCLTFDGNVMVAKITGVGLKVYVWTGISWKETASLPILENEVADITVDARYIVTANSHNVAFFRFVDGSYEQYGQTLTHGAGSVSINQNGDRAIIGESTTGSSHMYILSENGTWLRNAGLNINPGCAKISNDGKRFLTASDYTIRISQEDSSPVSYTSQIPLGWKQRGDAFPVVAGSLSLSDDGAYLIVGFTVPTLNIEGEPTSKFRVYNFAGDQWSQHGPDMTYPGLRDAIVEMSPDGTRFAVGGVNGAVRVFNNAFGSEGKRRNILESLGPVAFQKSTFGMSGDGNRLIVNDSVYDNRVETAIGNFGDTVHLSKSGDYLAVGDNETLSLFSLNSQGVVSQVGGRILPTDAETFSGLILRQSTAGVGATVDMNAATGGVLNVSTTLSSTTEISSLTYDSSAATVTSTRDIAVDDTEFTGFSTGGIVLSRNGERLVVYDSSQRFKVYSNGPSWTLLRSISYVPNFVALSPDGSRIAFNTSGYLKVQNTDSGTSLGPWISPVNGVFAFRNNDTIADLHNGVIRFWGFDGTNWVQPPLIFQVSLDFTGYLYSIDTPNTFNRLVWSGDGTRLAAADGSGINFYYDDQTTLTLPVFSFVQTGSTHTATLQVVSDDGTVKVIATSTDVQIFEKAGANWPSTATHTVSGAATSIDVSNDGTRVVVGTASKMFVVTNAGGSWAQLGSDVIGTVTNVAISGDGSKIFSDDSSAVKSFVLSSGNWVTYISDLNFADGRLIPTTDGDTIAISKSTGSGVFAKKMITFPEVMNFTQSGSHTGSKQVVGGTTFSGGASHYQVVGDPTDNSSTGSVKVFQQVGNGSATLLYTFNGSAAGEEFGRTVSVSTQNTVGVRVIIGGATKTTVFIDGYMRGQSILGNADIVQINGNGDRIYIYSQGVTKSYSYSYAVSDWVNDRPDITQTVTKIKASNDGTILAISDPGDCKVLIDTPVTQSYDFVPSGSTVSVVDEIAISGDASVRVIGDKTWNSSTGEVEIYEKDSNGNWLASPTVTFTGATTGEEFGRALGISETGSRIVIGSATKMIVVTNASGSWVQLGSDIPGPVSLVAISGDGTKIFSEDTLDLRSYELYNGNWVMYVQNFEGALSGIYPIDKIVASTDGTTLALSKPDDNRIVRIQTLATNSGYRFTQSGSSITANGQAISNNSDTKVVTDSTSIKIYQFPTLQATNTSTWPNTPATVTWPATPALTINDVATSVDVSTDGLRVVVGTASKMFVVSHDTNTGTWAQLGPDISGATQVVAISKDGTKVMSTNGPGSQLKSYEYVGGSWVTYLPDLAVNATSDDRIIASTNGEIIAFTSHGQTSHQVYNRENVNSYQLNLVNSYSGKSEQAISGNALVKVIGDPSYLGYTGLVEIYENVGGAWPPTPDATFQGGSSNENFGFNLAVSEDGTRIVVASYASGGTTPKVVVLEKSGGTWQQLGQDITGIRASKVAISGDGAYVFAYTPDEYLLKSYKLSGTTWVTYLADITADSNFSKFSVSTDGDIVAVPQQYTNSRIYSKQTLTNAFSIDQEHHYTALSSEGKLSGNGTVFVSRVVGSSNRIEIYEKTGGSWGTTPAYAHNNIYNSPRVDISHDGLRVIAYESEGFVGDTYVFENVAGSWSQLGQTIQGGGPITAAAISGDGTKIMRYSSSNSYVESYELSGGSWVMYLDDFSAYGVDDLLPSLDGDIVGLSIDNGCRVVSKQQVALSPTYSLSGNPNTVSGESQVISGTGLVKIIGTVQNTNQYRGKVDIYRFVSGSWTLEQTFNGSNAYNSLGKSLAISKDGNRAVIGGDSGTTFVIEYTGSYWSQLGSNFTTPYNIYAVGISGDGLVVYLNESDYLYSFEYSGGSWVEYAAQMYIGYYLASDQQNGIGPSLNGDYVSLAAESDYYSSSVYKLSVTSNHTYYTPNYYNLYTPGHNIKVSGDGNRIVTAEPNWNSGMGKLEVYDNSNPGFNFMGTHYGPSYYSYYGSSLDLSETGRLVAAGSNEFVVFDITGQYTFNQVGQTVSVVGQSNYLKIGISGDGTKIYHYNGDSSTPRLRSYQYDTLTSTWVQYTADLALGDIERIAVSTAGDVVALSKVGDNRVYEVQTTTTTTATPKGFVTPQRPTLLGEDYTNPNLTNQSFGMAMDCTSDGNRFVVADAQDVRVFDWDSVNSTWNIVGSKIAHPGGYNPNADYQVAISGDGNRLVISNPDYGGGEIKFYELNQYTNSAGTTQYWSTVKTETSYYSTERKGFGLAISADGTTVAVGSPFTNDTNYTGRVNLYEWGSWNYTYIDDSDAPNYSYNYASYDEFGTSVALSEDGTRLVVGSPGRDPGGNSTAHAMVYTVANTSAWFSWPPTKTHTYISGNGTDDRFGERVHMRSDGNQIVVSAPEWNRPGHGSNYGFVRNYEYTNGSWSALGNDIIGAYSNFLKGSSAVGLSGDGYIMVIGTSRPSGGYQGGVAEIYEKVVNANAPGGYDWSIVNSYTGGSTTSIWPNYNSIPENLGYDVVISRTGAPHNIFISTPNRDDGYTEFLGKVDVYTYNSGAPVTTTTTSLSQRGISLPGEGIDMSNDGSRVVGGSSYTWDNTNYVYDGPVGSTVPWVNYYYNSPLGATEVSISGDGTRAFTAGRSFPSGGSSKLHLWNWSGGEWTGNATNEVKNVSAVMTNVTPNTDGSFVTYVGGSQGSQYVEVTQITTTNQREYNSRRSPSFSKSARSMDMSEDGSSVVAVGTNDYEGSYGWNGVDYVYDGAMYPYQTPWVGNNPNGNYGSWESIAISRDGTKVIAKFLNMDLSYREEAYFFYKISHSGSVEWSDSGVNNPIAIDSYAISQLDIDTDGDVLGMRFHNYNTLEIYDLTYTSGGTVDRYLPRGSTILDGRSMDMTDDGLAVVTTASSAGLNYGYFEWDASISEYTATGFPPQAPWTESGNGLSRHRIAISGDGTKVLACFAEGNVVDSVRLYEKQSSTWTLVSEEIFRIDSSGFTNPDHLSITTTGNALSIFKPNGPYLTPVIYTITAFTGDTYLTRSTVSTGRIMDMDNAGTRIVSLTNSFSWNGLNYVSDSSAVPWSDYSTITDMALSGDGTRVIADQGTNENRIDYWYRSGSSWGNDGIPILSTSPASYAVKISINTDGSFIGFVGAAPFTETKLYEMVFTPYVYTPRGSAIQTDGDAIDMSDDGANIFRIYGSGDNHLKWSGDYWIGTGYNYWSSTADESRIRVSTTSSGYTWLVLVSRSSNVLTFRIWQKYFYDDQWIQYGVPFATLTSGTLNDVSLCPEFVVGVQHGSEVEFFDFRYQTQTSSTAFGYETVPVPQFTSGPMIDMNSANAGVSGHAVITQTSTFHYFYTDANQNLIYRNSTTSFPHSPAPWSTYDHFELSGDGLRVAAINSQGDMRFWYRLSTDVLEWSDLHVNTLSQGSNATELTMNTDGTIIGFWRTGALNEAAFYDIVFTPVTPTFIVAYGSRGYETDNIIDMSGDGKTVVTESGIWRSVYPDGNFTPVTITTVSSGLTDVDYGNVPDPGWFGSTFDQVAISGNGTRVVARSTTDELHMWEAIGGVFFPAAYTRIGSKSLTTADPKDDLSINEVGDLVGFTTTGLVKFYDFTSMPPVSQFEYALTKKIELNPGPGYTYIHDDSFVDSSFSWDASTGAFIQASVSSNLPGEIDIRDPYAPMYGGERARIIGDSVFLQGKPWGNHTKIRASGDFSRVYAIDSSGTLKRYTNHADTYSAVNWTVDSLVGVTNPSSISVSADGEFIGIIDGGQAKFYTFSSTQTPVGWSQHSSLTGDNESFDMSTDGNTLVVGDPQVGVRVYDYASGWSLRSTLALQSFGKSVSISSDGSRITAAADSGVVVRDWDGSAWIDPVFRRNPELPLGAVVEYVNADLILNAQNITAAVMSYDGIRFGVRTTSSVFAKRIAIGTVPGEVGWTNRRNSIVTLATGGGSTSMRSSSDGNIIAFGYVDSGTVRVRVYDLTSQLGPEISTPGSSISLDLTNDGTRLAVLVDNEARVYEYSAGVWSQVGSRMHFAADVGSKIRISGGNGDYVALGMNAPADPKPYNVLRVYKYDLDWRLISPTMTVAKTPVNHFGSSFALTDDGSRLVHSSVNDNAVEFSTFSGGGSVQFVQPSLEISVNGEGSRMALDSANVMVVSSFTDHAVRVYDTNNNLETSFTAPPSYVKTPGGDQLITSKPFSITKDGNKIVTVIATGEVAVYKKQGGTWSQDGNSVTVTGGRVSSLDITNNGQRIIVGNVTETTFSDTTGKAQVFDLTDGVWSQNGGDIGTTSWEHRFANVVSISDTGLVVVSGEGAYNEGQPVGIVQSYELRAELQDLTFRAPTIKLVGNSYVKLNFGEEYTELGATIDTQSSIVPQLKISGKVSTGVAGTYTIRYECEDLLRKKAAPIFRQVDVMEELQTFGLIGDSVVYHTKDTAYVDAGVDIGGATGYYVAPNSLVAVPGAGFTPTIVGDWKVVWANQNIDKHLRTGTMRTRTVRVRARPVLTLTGDLTIFHILNENYQDPGVTVDVGTVTATRPNVRETGVYTLTYNAVDAFGIEALPVTRTVNVKEKPSITAVQTSFYNTLNDPISVPAPTVITPEGYASDLTPFLQSSNTIDINTRGDYTIAHTLTDSDGISADPFTQRFSVGSHGSLAFSKTGSVFALSRNGSDLAVFDTTIKTYRVQGFAQYGDVATPAPPTSIKFTPDGQYMVVGMASHLTIGLVRVYKKNVTFSSGWEQVGFDLFGTDYLGKFGESVDINTDATRVVVGVPEAGTTILKSGKVKIYDWTGFTWNEAKVLEGTNNPTQFFGFSVSFDNEGKTLAVGSPGLTKTTVSGTTLTTTNIGKASVYKLSGSDWQLSGSEIEDGTEGKRNGTSVSLSRSGNVLAVGSVLGGGVRVYTYGTDWTLYGSHVQGSFGESVSLSSNGNTLVAGSKDENKGRVYKYTFGGDGWSRSTDTFDTIVAGEGSTTFLGKKVSLDGSGELLCVSSNTDVRIYLV